MNPSTHSILKFSMPISMPFSCILDGSCAPRQDFSRRERWRRPDADAGAAENSAALSRAQGAGRACVVTTLQQRVSESAQVRRHSYY